MFQRVVSSAQGCEVGGCGGAAQCGVDGVVNVAAVDREGAADEAAALVSRGEVSAEAGGNAVPVDGENVAGGIDPGADPETAT